MDTESLRILFVIIIILAVLSCISCICVCISIYNRGYRPCECKKKNRNTSYEYVTQTNQVNVILFWMCIIDGFHMLPIIANWIPHMFPTQHLYAIKWNKAQCEIIGIIAQFCGIKSASWHILLAYYLGCILCGGDSRQKIKKMYKQRYIHYVLVTIIPLIATFIPLSMEQNGYHINPIDGDKDCWLIGSSQYVFIIIIIIALIFHCFVLFIACIQFKKSNRKRYRIMVKLSKFVIVYAIIRFFPVIEAIYEISANVPYWLMLVQHLSISTLGIGNALVWFWNSNDDKLENVTMIKKEVTPTIYLSVCSVNTASPIRNNAAHHMFENIYNNNNNHQYQQYPMSKSQAYVLSDKQMDKGEDVTSNDNIVYSIPTQTGAYPTRINIVTPTQRHIASPEPQLFGEPQSITEFIPLNLNTSS